MRILQYTCMVRCFAEDRPVTRNIMDLTNKMYAKMKIQFSFNGIKKKFYFKLSIIFFCFWHHFSIFCGKIKIILWTIFGKINISPVVVTIKHFLCCIIFLKIDKKNLELYPANVNIFV